MVWQAIVKRAQFAWASAGLGRRTVIGVLAGLGLISTIRDHLFPKAESALIHWVVPVPGYVWTIIVLTLLFLFALDGGYRIQEKLTKKSTLEKQRIVHGLEQRLAGGHHALQLQVATTIWFGTEHGTDVNRILEWNWRLRKLKQAVIAGEIQPKHLQPGVHPSRTTEAETRSLIQFFTSGTGSQMISCLLCLLVSVGAVARLS